jgi:hypothetical protein
MFQCLKLIIMTIQRGRKSPDVVGADAVDSLLRGKNFVPTRASGIVRDYEL